MRRCTYAVLVVLTTMATVSACGVKAPPLPPLNTAPELSRPDPTPSPTQS